MQLIENEKMKEVMLLTDILGESIDPALIQIEIAIRHLRAIRVDLWDAYKVLQITLMDLQNLGSKNTPLIKNYNCSKESLFFLTKDELINIHDSMKDTIQTIEEIKIKNSPILSQITTLGFSAIKPN